MTQAHKRIFLTGATGYVGGTVLSRLLEHPTLTHTEICVLIRPSKVQDVSSKLSPLGIKVVGGTYDDLSVLEEQASLADVVIACADADNLAACNAILQGMQKRHESTHTVPLLIHTSGTGVLVDDARGMYASETIWDDMDVKQLDTIAPTQYHRNVDLAILTADSKGYIRSYIILPSTIYAHAKTKFVELGIQNPRSIQIPLLIRAGLRRGQGGVVGHGKSKWPNVHVDDIADLFIVVYEKALSGEAGHGHEGLYFGANGEYTSLELSKVTAQVLHELGKGRSPEPTPFTDADYRADEMLPFLGTNSRCKANRGRSLGWQPKYTTADMLASVRPEVEYSIKHEKF